MSSSLRFLEDHVPGVVLRFDVEENIVVIYSATREMVVWYARLRRSLDEAVETGDFIENGLT